MKKRIAILFVLLLFISCSSSDKQSDAKSDIVYVTNIGTKYHKSNCRHLSNSKIEIEKDKAIKKGYEPCKVCKPIK